jgi:hypothetical protein
VTKVSGGLVPSSTDVSVYTGGSGLGHTDTIRMTRPFAPTSSDAPGARSSVRRAVEIGVRGHVAAMTRSTLHEYAAEYAPARSAVRWTSDSFTSPPFAKSNAYAT